MKITFALLAESHFPLLLKWLEASHVKKWLDQDVAYTMDLVREKYSSYIKGYKLINGAQKPIQGFIIHNNQNPVGYIQIYNAYDFPRSKSLLDLPENLGAFDIFIGEAAALQQGLGSKAILEFLKLHGNPYTHIFADPDSNNVAAVKCYERAGFKKLSEQKDTKEVWMLLKNKVVSVNNVEHLSMSTKKGPLICVKKGPPSRKFFSPFYPHFLIFWSCNFCLLY
jgi:aminoglycoside 6'-N-acetyltransferase